MLERLCRLAAYQLDNTFQWFPESVRKRFVDGCLLESISVVVITMWLWVMA